MADKRKGGIVRANERPESWSFSHPLNENSEVHGQSLADACGMTRMGVHLMRIPAGKEAYVYHSHGVEEECFFILSGRAIAEIDGEEHEVGTGDFIGFGAPSVGHQLRNPFDEALVYLVAGERSRVEIAEYPKLGKRVLRLDGEAHVVKESDLELFWKDDG